MRSPHSRLAAAIIAGLFVAAACTSAASPTPVAAPTGTAATSTEPTSSSPASASPSPSPTTTTNPEPRVERPPVYTFDLPPGVLPPISRVVSIAPLEIRAEPGRSAALIATAPVGTILSVDSWWGPDRVDGVPWTNVAYGETRGSAAALIDGTRYLELAPARCPVGFDPDLTTLTSITAWEQLACFGDRSLTVVGTYGCPTCGDLVPGSYSPMWLADPANIAYLGSGIGPPLVLHFSPESGLEPPPNASIVRVTGHFNDAASSTCTISRPNAEGGEDPIDPPTAELYCRERFVVDGYEVIGSDPDFLYPPAR